MTKTPKDPKSLMASQVFEADTIEAEDRHIIRKLIKTSHLSLQTFLAFADSSMLHDVLRPSGVF